MSEMTGNSPLEPFETLHLRKPAEIHTDGKVIKLGSLFFCDSGHAPLFWDGSGPEESIVPCPACCARRLSHLKPTPFISGHLGHREDMTRIKIDGKEVGPYLRGWSARTVAAWLEHSWKELAR